MNSLFYIIYEFFVKYIFGGTLYLPNGGFEYYLSPIGFVQIFGQGDVNNFSSDQSYIGINVAKLGLEVINNDNDYLINDAILPIGNYLSLISTIITLVIICIFLGLFVRWVFKQFTSILRF